MKIKILATLIISIFVVVVFQNCSSSLLPGMRSMPSTAEQAKNPLPFEHPDPDIGYQGKPVSGQMVIGDRLFLQSVFRDVFAPPGSPANIVEYVDAVIYQELGQVQTALGRSCDINQDGTTDDCFSAFQNVDIKMNAGTSSIREAARIQVCRRILGNATMVQSMISQVKGNQPTPNDQSIAAIVYLFFPADNAPSTLHSSLKELDQNMAEGGESVADRWAILFLTVCESPAWQVL